LKQYRYPASEKIGNHANAGIHRTSDVMDSRLYPGVVVGTGGNLLDFASP